METSSEALTALVPSTLGDVIRSNRDKVRLDFSSNESLDELSVELRRILTLHLH
jgi:hypothetical protein